MLYSGRNTSKSWWGEQEVENMKGNFKFLLQSHCSKSSVLKVKLKVKPNLVFHSDPQSFIGFAVLEYKAYNLTLDIEATLT